MEQTIHHCLTSLGFRDESRDDLNAEAIRNEPELTEVWSTPPGSAWSSATQTVASIRRDRFQWTVTFVSRSSPTSAEILSKAFSSCVPTHDSATRIELESQRFLDLR